MSREIQEAVFEAGDAQIRLRREDCLRALREMDSGSVDVIVTSPPYNLGIDYESYDDSLSREDYLEWIEDWAKTTKRVLAEKGSLFLNMGGVPKDPWVPMDVAQRVRKHLVLQNMIHWIKSIALDKESLGNYPGLNRDISVGHYKPINSPRFINDAHEYIFHFTPSGDVPIDRLATGVPYQDKSNIGRWKKAKRDLRCRGNCWFIPYKTIMSRNRERPHPATFPAQLPEMCIKLHGVERARLVCDPFSGLGHTAQACMTLGIPFVGFEIDEEYWAESVKRLEQAGGMFIRRVR